MSLSITSIDELMKALPFQAQLEVQNFVEFLLTKHSQRSFKQWVPKGINKDSEQEVSVESKEKESFEEQTLLSMELEYPLTPISPPKPVHHFRGQIVGIKKGQQNLGLSDEQWSQLR
jgi:hypothetical protein